MASQQTSSSLGEVRQDRAVQPLEPDKSLGELFGQLGEDLGQLVTSQMELARTELKEEAKEAGQAAGMFGAGSVLGYLALTLLCFAAAWGLSEVVPEGVAFLIVGVVVGIAAGVVLMLGKQRLDAAKDVAPQTVQTLKEDAEWTREQMR
jgi:uncharacterized membrane protein YqjE